MGLTKIQRERLKKIADGLPSRLRIARTAVLMSQATVARELEMTRGRWSAYEKGQRLMDWRLALVFCVLTKIDHNYLFGGTVGGLDADARSRLRMAARQIDFEERGG